MRILLALQLAFFAAWGVKLLTSHDRAQTIWLATNPVDPRDLLSGHYVELRYRIGSVAATGCQQPPGAPSPTAVWVRLEQTGETIYTADGPVPISDAVACVTEPPVASAGEHWIAGRLPGHALGDIAYGIERFYVPEDSALRTAQSGSVVAKVAIGDGFAPRIVDLVPTVNPTAVP